jgi:predicted nicotinamide N-methyase
MILSEKIFSKYINFLSNFELFFVFIKIGAGTSLPGLVAAKIGAQKVVLCDNPKVDKWFPLIRETITLNSMIADRICIESLDWYDEKSLDELIKKYFPLNIDIIIGSDIFFHKKGRKRNLLFLFFL